MARKVIFVGECILDIVFEGMQPISAEASGLMLDTARQLASEGIEVAFAGEASADASGDFILAKLTEAGVDTAMVDRPVDSSTPMRLVRADRPGDDPAIYTRYSRERMSFGWPAARPGDIVVFGGYFALAQRSRHEVSEFIKMCADRGMIIVYLPGYEPQLDPAVTHVMPFLIEGLESADIVVTAARDNLNLWRCDDPQQCYRRNISFYVPLSIDINPATGVVTQCDESKCATYSMQPGRALPGRVLTAFLGALARDTRDDKQSILSNPPVWQPIH